MLINIIKLWLPKYVGVGVLDDPAASSRNGLFSGEFGLRDVGADIIRPRRTHQIDVSDLRRIRTSSPIVIANQRARWCGNPFPLRREQNLSTLSTTPCRFLSGCEGGCVFAFEGVSESGSGFGLVWVVFESVFG